MLVGKGKGSGSFCIPRHRSGAWRPWCCSYQEYPRGCTEGRFWGKQESWGRIGQDSLLAKNSSISTEVAHEVGGNSAEVKGQDVPVIVGVGSPTGKALIAGRTRRVVATRVLVGLDRLFPITISIKGILPLRAREREVRSLETWPFLF